MGESEASFNSLTHTNQTFTHTVINNQCAAERNNKQKKKKIKQYLKHYNYTALSAIYYLFIYDFARALKTQAFFEV